MLIGIVSGSHHTSPLRRCYRSGSRRLPECSCGSFAIGRSVAPPSCCRRGSCSPTVAFLTGGLFHRHYWVTLTFPFACAAAVAIAPRRRPRIGGALLIAVVCIVIAPSLISTSRVIRLDRNDVALVANDDPRLVVDERVGQWYDANRTADSTLYVMCASAGAYAHADAIPPYPYLWLDGVQNGKGAEQKLVDLFSGDDAPTFVAMYQNAWTCNPSGEVAALLQQRYITVHCRRRGTHPRVARPRLKHKRPGRRTFAAGA